MNKVLLRSFVFAAMVLVASFSACQKDEILVPDNTAPPDSTVSTLVLENYVTKCYISLLGREPDANEETAAVGILENGNLNVSSRKQMLDVILDSPEYTQKLVEYNSIKLLNAYDTSVVIEQLWLLNFLLTDPQYAPFYDLINYEIGRYTVLLNTPEDLANGSITVPEMHIRLIDNGIYDDLNAGSFNFVLSIFNHFLFRDPTASEHDAGITMVDGFVAVVLLETGNSKDDFIDIFFGSDDYYEGQVRELFLRYLFREPTSEEEHALAVSYKNSGDFKELQKSVLSLDEFVGS